MLELVVLDVNGTLFSLDPVAEELAAIGLDGQLDLWFARVLRDGFAAAAAGTFVAFPDLGRHHLAILLEERGAEATEDRLARVLGAFEHVTAHPDVEPALRQLQRHGVTVATMTNGTVAIARSFLVREGLADHVDAMYDVAMVGRWKPAPEAYQHVLEQHGCRASDAALVAVHPWDVHGAAAAGLATGWVNRTGSHYPDAFATPDVAGRSMEAVVEDLLSR